MTQVIEQTGKKWKAIRVLSGLSTLTCAVILAFMLSDGASDGSPPTLTIIVLAVSFGLYVFGRVGTWWNHS